MSLWLLYLMTRTEAIAHMLNVFCFFTIFIGLIVFTAVAVGNSDGGISNETMASTKRMAKWLGSMAVIAGLMSAFFPTRQDWYLIAGGYYVTHIEGIDKLPKDTVAAIDEFLKQYAKEPKPDTNKEGRGA